MWTHLELGDSLLLHPQHNNILSPDTHSCAPLLYGLLGVLHLNHTTSTQLTIYRYRVLYLLSYLLSSFDFSRNETSTGTGIMHDKYYFGSLLRWIKWNCSSKSIAITVPESMVENKAVPVYIHITVVRREYDDLNVRFHLLFSHLSKELRPKNIFTNQTLAYWTIFKSTGSCIK